MPQPQIQQISPADGVKACPPIIQGTVNLSEAKRDVKSGINYDPILGDLARFCCDFP
jgi:hypothetical protein